MGYDLTTGRISPSYYDLLASEARIAVFVAIAKGDIPQEAWFHLGRAHTLFEGERILLSWTGTMFEYLMPTIWMRHHPGTITHNSIRGVVKAQREYARRKGVPWGISESACLAPDGSYGYGPFGIAGAGAEALGIGCAGGLAILRIFGRSRGSCRCFEKPAADGGVRLDRPLRLLRSRRLRALGRRSRSVSGWRTTRA